MKTSEIRKLCVVSGMVLCTARAVAGTDVWTGAAGDSLWSTAGNWAPGVPGSLDALAFQGSAGTSPNNDLTGLTVSSIVFSNGASAFTLGGNAITLSHFNTAMGAVGGTVGITNASSNIQNINLNVNLDWGNYIFDSLTGSLAINGQLNSASGIALLGTNLTTTSLSLDASGLISGLGGAGLRHTNGVFTGLATLSGGSVTDYTYPAECQIGGGLSIGASVQADAKNLYLTATPSATKSTNLLANASGNTFINSIVFSKTSWTGTNIVGNSSAAGQLVLGSSGGIYIPASGTSRAEFTNSLLTAGPASGVNVPGILVLGANSSAGIVIYSGITNNLTGGAVTVVKTGSGTVNISSVNKGGYSGATYVNQGTLVVANANSFGCGPYYLASNATLFVRGNTTNDFYISKGGGALKLDPITLSGKLTLAGSPVSAGTAGNRVTLNNNSTISGQITGTGTLDVYGDNNSWSTTLNNASTTATNDWTGGLFINGWKKTTVKLGSANQLAGNNVSIFPNSGVFAFLDLNGKSDVIGGLSSPNYATFATNCVVTNATATACTLTLGANNGSGTFNGIVGGPISLVKIGTGTQTFGGLLTYSGNTTISQGTLALSSNAAFGGASITINNNATLDVSGRADQTLTLTNNQTLTANGTVNGKVVANTGSTINWMSNAQINGALAANAGSTIQVGGSLSIGAASVANNTTLAGNLVMEVNNSSTPNCDQFNAAPGAVTYGGTLVVNNIGPDLQVGDTFQLFPGAVTGFASYNLATSDAHNVYAYTWENRIAIDGSIRVASVRRMITSVWWKGDVDGTWNTASPSFNWDTDQSAGTDAGFSPEPATDVHFSANSAANFNTTLGADFSIETLSFDTASSVSVGGANTLAITGGINNSISAGSNTISVSKLAIDADQTFYNASANPLTISSSITGPQVLTIDGSGATRLMGSNSFNKLILNAGTLTLGNSNALALTNSCNNGATLDLNGQTLAGGLNAVAGTGVDGNGAIVNSSTTPAKIAGALNIGGSAFTVGGIGDVDLARVTGAGGLTLTKAGANTLTLSGTADNAFLALIVNAGKVVLSKASGNGVRAIGNGLTINGGLVQLAGTGGDLIYDGNTVLGYGGTLDLNGCSETVKNCWLMGTGTGAGALINSAPNTTSTLTVTNDPSLLADTTIGGAGDIILPRPFTGSFTLTKVGNGTLTLSGAGSGAIVVNGGTLAITSTYQGGDISVSDSNAVEVVGGAQSAQINNLTLGNNLGATTLVFTNMSSNGIPLLNALGTVTVAVSNSISIASTNGLAVGNVYPLLKYGSLSSADFGRMKLVTPSAMTGNLTNDTANGWVALAVNSFVSPIATNSTNITMSVSGKTLTLSWPADHLGWILQSQTNSLNVGLCTNWVDVVGSDAVTSTNIAIDGKSPTMFLRLRKP